MQQVIYLDHAATTRPFSKVVEEMLPYYRTYYGNASSDYEVGEDSKYAIRKARRRIAATLQVSPDHIFFTSGGTEGNNWILRKNAELLRQKGRHIITSEIEHPSVLNTCKMLEENGFEVTYLQPDRFGMLHAAQLAQAIRPDTILISVMFANNEIGTIQPIRELAYVASQKQILFHTDAVQVYGHIPVRPVIKRVDFFTASSHKFYGPKGVGFVYIKHPSQMQALLTGGGQEKGLRAGTENVPGIVGMGAAAEISCTDLEKKMALLSQKREYLLYKLREALPDAIFNGHPLRRLPGNINLCIPGIDSGALRAMLDLEGICVSAASACSAKSKKPSYVLLAIGRTEMEAEGAVRITLGLENTKEELDTTAIAIKRAVEYLR